MPYLSVILCIGLLILYIVIIHIAIFRKMNFLYPFKDIIDSDTSNFSLDGIRGSIFGRKKFIKKALIFILVFIPIFSYSGYIIDRSFEQAYISDGIPTTTKNEYGVDEYRVVYPERSEYIYFAYFQDTLTVVYAIINWGLIILFGYLLSYLGFLWYFEKGFVKLSNIEVTSFEILNRLLKHIRLSSFYAILFLPIWGIILFSSWLLLFMMSYTGHGRPFRPRRWFSWKSREAEIMRGKEWK